VPAKNLQNRIFKTIVLKWFYSAHSLARRLALSWLIALVVMRELEKGRYKLADIGTVAALEKIAAAAVISLHNAIFKPEEIAVTGAKDADIEFPNVQ
jgi:hypothetical protein